MNITINWLTEVWSSFSLWTSTQPTFLQVALGMGLFYVVLQLLRLLYRVVYYTLSGLFAGRSPKIKKDFKSPNRPKKHVSMDDDAPPFVFR